MSMAYVIAEPCIGFTDETKQPPCVEACCTDCIHPANDGSQSGEIARFVIDPMQCTDCGACAVACPVAAVYPLEELPEQWKNYAALNAGNFRR